MSGHVSGLCIGSACTGGLHVGSACFGGGLHRWLCACLLSCMPVLSTLAVSVGIPAADVAHYELACVAAFGSTEQELEHIAVNAQAAPEVPLLNELHLPPLQAHPR